MSKCRSSLTGRRLASPSRGLRLLLAHQSRGDQLASTLRFVPCGFLGCRGRFRRGLRSRGSRLLRFGLGEELGVLVLKTCHLEVQANNFVVAVELERVHVEELDQS